MDAWQIVLAAATVITAAAGGIATAIATTVAKNRGDAADTYKALYEGERAERVRVAEKLDGFYREGRELSAKREAENAALRDELEALRAAAAARRARRDARPA